MVVFFPSVVCSAAPSQQERSLPRLALLTNENNKTDSTNRVIERERQRQSDCGKDH